MSNENKKDLEYTNNGIEQDGIKQDRCFDSLAYLDSVLRGVGQSVIQSQFILRSQKHFGYQDSVYYFILSGILQEVPQNGLNVFLRTHAHQILMELIAIIILR